MQGKSKRILYLDVARCAAIVLIALNHVANRSYDNYYDQIGEFQTMPLVESVYKAAMTVASHLGVPLFLMITGALLLGRSFKNKEDVIRFYKHNWVRILITSEIWFFVTFWFRILGSHRDMLTGGQLPELLLSLVKTLLFVDQYVYDSMWYIPMILAVYLMIPVFALAIEKLSLYALLIPYVLVILDKMIFPNINSFIKMLGLSKRFAFAISATNMFSEYFLYLIAGYWIANGGLRKMSDLTVRLSTVLGFAAMTAYQTWCYSREANYLLGYTFTGIFVVGALLFELIKRDAPKMTRFTPVFEAVSKRSFAMYFSHIMVMTTIIKLPFVSAFPKSLLSVYLEVGSLVGSLVLIEILSKVPLLKKYMLYM